MIPNRQSGNVYTILLYDALQSIGMRYVDIPFSLPYLLRHPPHEPFHYLHFHWPEVFFRIRARAVHRLFGLKGYVHLHGFWDLAKRRGYRLVWTVHEVDVHDLRRHRSLYEGSRRKLWRMADIVFAHSDEVSEAAVHRWGAREHVYTVPHGDFAGAYPDSMPRNEARARLQLPDDAVVFLFLGNIRPYKGVEELLDAFGALQAETPRTHLLIVGQPKVQALGDSIRARAAGIPNLHLHLGFAPDSEIQLYMRAADCFVAPYRYVETSGSIYLALTFGLPIITKLEGNVRAFCDKGIGFLLEDMAAMPQAMREFLALSDAERRQLRANVADALRDDAWDRVAERYRAAFAAYETSSAPALTVSPDPG